MISHVRPRSGFPATLLPTPLFIVCAVLLSMLSTRPALAQDQGTIDKLVQMNKRAMDDYDTADFDTAKKTLLDAEKTGKRAGLEGHPVMARTYIHLGALYLVGYKDKQKAQHYFGKALDIQPDINLDRTLTSASVRDLFAAVKSQKGEPPVDDTPAPPPPRGNSRGIGGKRGRPPEPVAVEPEADATTRRPTASRREEPASPASDDSGGEPDLPATITALDCPYPDDAPPKQKVTLRCVAAPSLGVAGATLHYKGLGMSDYQAVPMTVSEKGWWQATVPKKRVDGKSLQFYFEGLDASGTPVVSNGRAQSPNVLLIVERGNRVGAGAGKGDEEENPLEANNEVGPKLLLGTYDKSRIGVDSRYGNRRFWVGLAVGTGFTYAINGSPEARVNGAELPNGTFDMTSDVVISGFGWAGLGQVAPEIGVQINPDWAISIEGRHQWIPQASRVAGYTASGAHAGLLKVIRYTKQQRFRLFFAGAVGGGEGARMNIQTDLPIPGQTQCPISHGVIPAQCSNSDLKDTVLVGQVLVGGTVGVYYEISKRFSWIAEVNAFFGAPKKGFVFDINSGLQLNFGDTSGAAEAAAAKKKGSVSTSVDDEEPQ
jgi:hypothetical protein